MYKAEEKGLSFNGGSVLISEVKKNPADPLINHIIVMISKDIMSYCINRRKSHPNLIWSDPASSEQTVHLASLQLLFFSSVANTAPLWLSRRLLQSTPPLYCKVTCQNNVYEINVLYIF